MQVFLALYETIKLFIVRVSEASDDTEKETKQRRDSLHQLQVL